MDEKIISTALKGIAVAMGVAVIVLNTIGTLLSLDLTAMAIAALQI